MSIQIQKLKEDKLQLVDKSTRVHGFVPPRSNIHLYCFFPPHVAFGKPLRSVITVSVSHRPYGKNENPNFKIFARCRPDNKSDIMDSVDQVFHFMDSQEQKMRAHGMSFSWLFPLYHSHVRWDCGGQETEKESFRWNTVTGFILIILSTYQAW